MSRQTKQEREYQRSHHDYPCAFCGVRCESVVGHHLRIHIGAGMKAHDAGAVPACFECHQDCHNGKISKRRQKEAWLKYTAERLVEKHGEAEAFRLHCLAIWSIL